MSRLALLASVCLSATALSAGVFEFPTYEIPGDSYSAILSRDGQSVTYQIYRPDNTGTTYATWRDGSWVYRDVANLGSSSDPSYIDMDYTGSTLLLQTYDSTGGNPVYFWGTDGFKSYELGDSRYLRGFTLSGNRAWGYDYSSQQSFWMGLDGSLTYLEGTNITPIAVDKYGEFMLGEFYDGERYEWAMASYDQPFETWTIDGQRVRFDGISPDGSTLAFQFADQEANIGFFRDDHYTMLKFDADNYSFNFYQMSYDGTRAIFNAFPYRLGAMSSDFNSEGEFFLYDDLTGQLINLRDFLEANLPDDIVSVQGVDLTLDGQSLLVRANDSDDNALGLRIDGLDALVVPEPETYALMALGVGLLGAYAWTRRRSAKQA